MEMQSSGRNVTQPDGYLADNGILLSVMEIAFFLVVLVLSILFTLLALSYLQTYFRSRLEARIASRSAENRAENAMPLSSSTPGKTA
jgi:hypothetical protein